MVQAARGWYAADGSLFRFRGGRFLAQVFPDVAADFEVELRTLIANGDLPDIKMVLALLQNYDGGGSIHPLCKDIVDGLPECDKLLVDVTIALSATGVVSGQFGFVEAYEECKAYVTSWLQDPRPKVQQFARDFIHKTDHQIAAEQRRADEDQALRRLEFEQGE